MTGNLCHEKLCFAPGVLDLPKKYVGKKINLFFLGMCSNVISTACSRKFFLVKFEAYCFVDYLLQK